MKRIRKQTAKNLRLAKRTRSRIKGSSARPRLSIFRSNRYLWAQIIDDEKGVTVASESDRGMVSDAPKKGAKKSKDNLSRRERAGKIGELIAGKAKEKNIREVRFDRGRFRYHGLVAALAAGARKGGLKF